MVKELNEMTRKAVLGIVGALYSALLEAGEAGVPAGHLYAACMCHLKLDQFQTIMDAIVMSGRAQRRGHVYYATVHQPKE